MSLVLTAALVAASVQVYSLAQERASLSQELTAERFAHVKTRVAMKNVEMRFATYALDNRVRREFVDERLQKQEEQSAELERKEEAVRQQKLAEANCITPKSILQAAGL
ncbi:hypothetical protein [Altericroceibacterium xinjiangense]|uniref:hypothetical protein n=1 Tax=Altericroceibacterium xinjiangense TaxID=762261 RepID=UPI0019D07046|nr:hypothetical protein [Altericroceibacterium xinjiangense]